MKHEPLKGKVLLWNQITGDIETTDGKYFLETKTEDAKFFRIFLKKDVKSAVQGLLEEIEERIQECIEDKKRFEPKDRLWNSFDGQLIGLEKAEDLIKKWFADVINKEEER